MPLGALLIIEKALYLFIRGSTSSPGPFSLASLFPPHLQSQGKVPWGRGCTGRAAGQGMGFVLSVLKRVYTVISCDSILMIINGVYARAIVLTCLMIQ